MSPRIQVGRLQSTYAPGKSYWQPRCRRFSLRPVALRPCLSTGVPLSRSDRYTAQIVLSILMVDFGEILSNRFFSVRTVQKRQLLDSIPVLFLRPLLLVRYSIRWEKSRNVISADVQSDRVPIVNQDFCKEARGVMQP